MIAKRLKKSCKRGLSTVEVVITVALFTIFMTSMLLGFNTMVNINLRVKEHIFSTMDEVNEISKKYYLGKED